MAWTTPVTDRESGAICTTTDMNRISQNIDWLATELTSAQLYSGGTVSKTSWTTNDYITVANWTEILTVLTDMVDALAVTAAGSPDESQTYENYNLVEDITLQIYNRYQFLLSQANLNKYAGQTDLYSRSVPPAYAGGLAV